MVTALAIIGVMGWLLSAAAFLIVLAATKRADTAESALELGRNERDGWKRGALKTATERDEARKERDGWMERARAAEAERAKYKGWMNDENKGRLAALNKLAQIKDVLGVAND